MPLKDSYNIYLLISFSPECDLLSIIHTLVHMDLKTDFYQNKIMLFTHQWQTIIFILVGKHLKGLDK